MLERFGDSERGGFFFTSDDHEELLTRNRSVHDGALPAGSGVAAGWLSRLGDHLGNDLFERAAQSTLAGLRPAVERSASAFGTLLLAAEREQRPKLEVTVAGPRHDPATSALVARARAFFLPQLTLAAGSGADVDGLPLFEGRGPVDGRPAAYVCRDRVCGPPLAEPGALDAALKENR